MRGVSSGLHSSTDSSSAIVRGGVCAASMQASQIAFTSLGHQDVGGAFVGTILGRSPERGEVGVVSRYYTKTDWSVSGRLVFRLHCSII